METTDLSSTRIPEEEITHLLLTLTDAFHLAAGGETRRGYLKVLGGVVRTSTFTREQYAWAQDLRAHWDRAMQEFLERHPGSDLEDHPAPPELDWIWCPKPVRTDPQDKPGHG